MLLAWGLIAVWGANWLRESTRITQAEEHIKEAQLEMGTELYAQNCVVCHGPLGEGVVGPPLDRKEFKGDPGQNQETYDLLYKTVQRGRPGTSDPKWQRLPNGHWASFTAMPMWANSEGGPLNEQQLRALARFIMQGDWTKVSGMIPAATMPQKKDKDGHPTGETDTETLLAKMPDGVGISKAASLAGKQLFVAKGCIACHTMGSFGGGVGPNLTKVGSWGVDPLWREFLKAWILNPQAVKDRAPVYWSNYSGPLLSPSQVAPGGTQRKPGTDTTTGAGVTGGERGGDRNIGGSISTQDFPIPESRELGPTLMPKIPFTDEELDTLLDWLISLR